MFCCKCGAEIPPGMQYCGKCGTKAGEIPTESSVPNALDDYATEFSEKSGTKTAILAMLFGPLGIHDFYTGNIIKGVIKLILTSFGFFLASAVWTLIDMYRLAVGTYKDGDDYTLEPAPWVFVYAIIFAVLSIVIFIAFIRILIAYLAV